MGYGIGIETGKRYARGGSVQGRHGIDKVPAKLTADEYVLPVNTVKAIGTDALDRLVRETNGKEPGGKVVDGVTQDATGGVVKPLPNTPAPINQGILPPVDPNPPGGPMYASDRTLSSADLNPPGGEAYRSDKTLTSATPLPPQLGVLTKARNVVGYADGGTVLPDELQPKNLNTDPVSGADLMARMGTPGFESVPGSSTPPAPGIGINQTADAPPNNLPPKLGFGIDPGSTAVQDNSATAPPSPYHAPTPGSQPVGNSAPQTSPPGKNFGADDSLSNTTITGRVSASPETSMPAATPASSAPGIGINRPALQRPGDAIALGIDQQRAYGDAQYDKAMDFIKGGADVYEQAARARMVGHVLPSTAGTNNFAQTQEQGAAGLNVATNQAEANQTAALGEKSRGELESEQAHEARLKSTEQQEMLDLQQKIEDPNTPDKDRSAALQAWYRRSGRGPYVPLMGTNMNNYRPEYVGALNTLTGEKTGGQQPASASTAPANLEAFMAASRLHNPGASDEDLKAYYNQKYGQKNG